MKRKLSLVIRCGLVFAGATALVSFFAAQPHARAADAPPASPSTFLTTLGKKFYGSGSCTKAGCHAEKKQVANNPNYWGNEYLLWHDGKDPHRNAAKTLGTDKSKEIAKKLNIPTANTSERCLNCHATLAVTADKKSLKGPNYSTFEGVSCNSCHGPAQDYLEPHTAKGWIDKQRAELKDDHDALLKKFGLYDTLPMVYRAERCTSCHLAIEPDLVAAGHPQTTFEMNFFSDPKIYHDLHWHELDTVSPAGLWAAGQLCELHDAMLQLQTYAAYAAEHPKEDTKPLVKAYYQAFTHYTLFHMLFDTGAVASPDLAALDADIKTIQSSLSNMGAMGKACAAAAEHCDTPGIRKAIADFKKPDAATAKKLLAAVAKPDLGITYPDAGAKQQVLAIVALSESAGLKPVSEAVAPLVPKEATGAPAAADLTKALPDIRAKIGG